MKGLHQGGPLSPFLFIMVTDCLSRMLSEEAESGAIEGFKIGVESLSINHVLFVDDTILFSSLTKYKLSHLFNIIHNFKAASSLGINHTKSKFFGH